VVAKYEDLMAEFDASLTPDERQLAQAFDDHYALAREIASLRRSLGLSQTQLAALSGVTQPEISRIEHAETGVSVARTQRILRSMGSGLSIVRPSAAPMAASARSKDRHS
jgi:DNA-binding transcriptional regulator YiaG